MSRVVEVVVEKGPETHILKARWCVNFWCRLRGLMFRKELPDGIGLVLVEGREGVANTTIHMFAVPFAIGVLWVNSEGKVVDKVVAQPWRVYAPALPACYIVEGPITIVDKVDQGDRIEFNEILA